MAVVPNMEQFELYFRRADLDQDGRITGPEAVAFFQASNLSKQVLAQIWMHADQDRTGYLGRAEFYNFLKLATVAQSKQDLTPNIVKAALYGPASAKIPAPRIDLAVLPTPQPNIRAGTPSQQFAGTAPMTYQNTGTRGSQGFPPQQNQVTGPPRPLPPGNVFHSQQGVASQGFPGGGNMAASPTPPSSTISTEWLGGGTGGLPAVVTSQGPSSGSNASTTRGGLGMATSGLTPSPRPTVLATTASKPNDSDLSANQMGAKDSKSLSNLGNGFASDQMFGDVFSVQDRQNSPVPASSTSGLPVSSVTVPASSGPKATARPMQSAHAQLPTGGQNQQIQSTMKVSQQFPVQNSSPFLAGGRSSAPGQPNVQWPKMTQAAVQKYNKVFVEVDTDRDGKITGEQARNLFTSWKLPRDILKQVWDLSDQDNDSMLSLREFCVALYLMERFVEGRPLPSVLPSNIIFEDAQFPALAQPAASADGNASWRHNPGLQQTQGVPGPRPVGPAAGGKPPRPVPVAQPDEENVQRSQQKPRLPVLEKHLVDQLSTEEQNLLNSKFKELTEADKKVTELEKEIMDSKEKIEFYRTKMQELILYKSRCDSRLNEITERVSAEKREVETLAKKYEEKYKQSGDVASKLTIEEATFRDIQEKKMELYRAIVKLEQEGTAEKIQVHADHIQSDLEEQVKTLNERCKTYGLRAKPTTLVELPFGWQPGIQEGTADWDEEWDHFEDEGFTSVKEFTLDVKNVIAPPKSKASVVRKEKSQTDEEVPEPSSNGKSENLRDGETSPEHKSETTNKEAENSPSSKNAVDSPSNKNAVKSPSKNFQDSPSKKGVELDGTPHAMETQSQHGDAESVLSEDRRFDEPAWGSFDTHYDTDAGWDFNLDAAKDSDNERHSEASLFGPDSWGLNPIRTDSTHTDNVFQKNSTYAFADSVPSTPMSNYGATPHTDNLFEKKSPSAFTDSVPSTPTSSYGNSLYSDNMFQKSSTFGFADSVPSTPMYNSVNSPQRFGEGPEDHSFDNLSRFDSFNDGGLFPSHEFSRFDSMSSTRDSDNGHGLFAPRESFARFDSFRSTADSEYNPVFPPHDSFTRFDSMSSTRDNDYSQSFPSLDDTDPFGSSDTFKSSFGSETPRRDTTDSWKAF